MVHLARCCTPVPGDEIMGFVTQGRGVSVHRADCSNAAALARRSEERLIEVEWDQGSDGRLPRHARGPGLRPLPPARRRQQGGRRAPPEHRGRRTHTTPDRVSRMGFDVELADPAHLQSLLELAQAPRRRLRRLPPPPRQAAVSRRQRRQAAPPRAPSGTHDVLWPESARWEALRGRASPRLVESAGFGLADTPMFEDAAVFRRGIGEASDVVGKEMYEFEDRDGRCSPCGPRAPRSIVRAFVQHRPPLPWKAWYVTPAFRYERPQAGRYRQHHQVGVEVLGHRRPRPRRRGDRAGRRSSARSGWPTSRCSINSMGDGACRPGLPRPAARRTSHAHAAELCAEHRDRSTPTRCGSSTASAPECRAVDRGVPAPRRPPLRRLRAPHFARVRGGLEALGIARRVDHRLVRGLRLLHPHDLRVRLGRPRGGPERHRRGRPLRRPGRGARRARRRRASASASASSGSCWPATPRASSPSSRPPLDAFVVDVTGGTSRPRPDASPCATPGLRADRASTGAR